MFVTLALSGVVLGDMLQAPIRLNAGFDCTYSVLGAQDKKANLQVLVMRAHFALSTVSPPVLVMGIYAWEALATTHSSVCCTHMASQALLHIQLLQWRTSVLLRGVHPSQGPRLWLSI